MDPRGVVGTVSARPGYEWVTLHTLRKTVATLLDETGLTARQLADLLGRSRVSMTRDVHFGRGQQSRASAEALAFVAPNRGAGKVGNKLATGPRQQRTPGRVTWGFGGPPGDRTLNPRIVDPWWTVLVIA